MLKTVDGNLSTYNYRNVTQLCRNDDITINTDTELHSLKNNPFYVNIQHCSRRELNYSFTICFNIFLGLTAKTETTNQSP